MRLIPTKILRILFKMFFENNSLNINKNECRTYLKTAMEKHNVPVIGYAIINDYKLSFADTISIDPEIAASIDSLFQGCSFSKSLTALGILLLVSQGKVNLDTPLNQQLKTWKISEGSDEAINIRQCLSMTSGLCYGSQGISFPGYPQTKSVPTLQNILNGTSPATNHPIKLSYTPGSQYSYSGAGYMVLQKLIEDITQQLFSTFVLEKK